MKISILLLLTVILASCSPISLNRTFLDEMKKKDDRMFRVGGNFDPVPGDRGKDSYTQRRMLSRTPNKDIDFPDWSQEQQVKKELKEKLLKLSLVQKKWFRQNEGIFENDSNKVYFLGLSRSERLEYLDNLNSQRIGQTAVRTPSSYFKYSPRENRNVELGMQKDAVIQVWGRPHRVDVAGNPKYGNERWTFYEGRQKRFVYFENGLVEGWVTE